MSAHMVSAEHINVMVHAGLSIGGFRGGEVFILTTEEPTPYNGVQSSGGYSMRVLRTGTETAFGQMLLDANAASVNARYQEEEAYVYAYQRPQHTDWEPVEILGAINGYEYQACETDDWLTSEAKAFCDRLRKLAPPEPFQALIHAVFLDTVVEYREPNPVQRPDAENGALDIIRRSSRPSRSRARSSHARPA